MAVLRALARPMMASIFIVQGYDTLRQPERVAPRAEKVVGPLKERVDALPDDTEQLVRINGGIQLVAGSLLAIGRWPRLSALALAATLIPTTLAGHPYWEAKDDEERAQQRIHFLKNLAMLGGLLIAAADTEGNPSLAWRSRHAVQAARRDVSLATRTAKASGKAGAKVGATVGKAQGTADLALAKADLARARAGTARARAGRVRAEKVAQARTKAGQAAHKASVKAGKAAGKTAGRAGVKAGKTATRAGFQAGRVKAKAEQLTSR
ncbi:MAG TPA: DoxX family protein [Streptosporangiaceae bacterium]